MNINQYIWTLITGITLGLIMMLLVFAAYTTPIISSFATIEGAWTYCIVLLIKISVISGMALFMIVKWFKQEEQYLSDLPILFGLFFLILIFAKLLDILSGLIFYTAEPDAVFSILKIRFLLAVINLLPMLYLSVGMALYYLSMKEKYQRYSDNTILNRTRARILIMVIVIDVLAISLSPDYSILISLLPFLVIPALLMIVWLFAFAYRNQRLSQVHPLIIAIGFTIYLFSTVTRSILQKSLDLVTSTLISETIEIICFIIIFIGLLVSVQYKEN